MTVLEHPRPVWTSDDGTMAYRTARTRWDRIVNDMVDDTSQTLEKLSDSKGSATELRRIRSDLEELRNDIRENKSLSPIADDGDEDIRWFNKQLNSSDPQLYWHAAPWLFAECYLYRRVQALFSRSIHWRGYDVFKRQKDSSFVNARASVEELAAGFISRAQEASSKHATEQQIFALFSEMLQISLWGNASDLSLLNRMQLEELQQLQGRNAFAKAYANIVDNDIEELWAYLKSESYQQSDRRVDIVLDNAGFELFTDLVLAAYLVDCGIASKVRLRVKSFPWFVSDATANDVRSLFDMLSSTKHFPDRTAIDPLSDRFSSLVENGKIEIVAHRFWTTGSSFWNMPARAPSLFNELAEASLVIFKGDLNYRKLTTDGLWPYTTSFQKALGPLGCGSGIRVLALRTNKADVCVGLSSAEQVQELNKACSGGEWVSDGKFAVASFSNGA